MKVDEYYQALTQQRASIMAECIADEETFALHITSHNALKDFERMLGTISGLERKIFTQACREYQYSLEAIMYGNYRHAFSSLRLSLELFTGAVYFSAHQMKMNLWLNGHDDLWWSVIMDDDKGVYSESFMKAFNPQLMSYRNQYMGLARSVYRECSEYVHGNPVTHEDVSVVVSYDADRAQSFHDKVETVRLCILFLFVSRYLSELSPGDLAVVEPIVLESFGSLPEIQAHFGGDGV